MDATSSDNTSRSSRILPCVFGALAVASCIAIAVIGYRAYGDAENDRSCRDNLERIGSALHQYHDRFGSFPPAYVVNDQGRRLHSWRVLLLPFLGHAELYRQYRFDEPWDSTHNRQLLDQMPAVYGCPADKKRPTGTTNYVAIVGPQTVWPEHCAISIAQIEDGNTILLTETVDVGIAWLEPRDLSYDDLKNGGYRSNPRPSYKHLERMRLLMVDGSVEIADRQFYAKVFRALCTPAGGLPFPGVPWDLPVTTAEEIQTVPRPASELARTDVMPHRNSAIVPGRNLVYCSNFQIAWDRLREDVVKAPVELTGAPEMARHMNEQPFPRECLSEHAYVALAGWVSDGILDRIRSQMAEKFPSVKPRLPPASGELDAIAAYAYLQKRLPFEMDFDRLKQPMQFRAADTEVDVASFGIEDFASHDRREKELRKQVTVFDYVSDNDFIIQLTTKQDAIILAKIPRSATLAKTLAQVKTRSRQPIGHDVQKSLDLEEPLVVPVISLFVERKYSELVGRNFRNPGFTDKDIVAAMQLIRFQLDESGAVLEGEAVVVTWNGDEPPPQPRRFVFDRPFLIYLQEREAKQPYFVMWVENPEVLVQTGDTETTH